MLPFGESLHPLDPDAAALDAVKSYVRTNRDRLIVEGELLALLMPERFDGNVHDMQRFAIEKLTEENQTLRAERDALKGNRARRAVLHESVRRSVLDLIGACSLDAVKSAAERVAGALGADMHVFCAESFGVLPPLAPDVRLLAPGTVRAVVGEGLGAILAGGGDILFGPGFETYASLAAFRLRLDDSTPGLLFVLGARDAGCFDGRDIETDLRFFSQVLERAMRALLTSWTAAPKP